MKCPYCEVDAFPVESGPYDLNHVPGIVFLLCPNPKCDKPWGMVTIPAAVATAQASPQALREAA